MRILAEAMLDTGYDYVQNLERQYDLAIRTVEEQIRAWYQRFAGENGLTFAEAKRLLTTKELQEFRWTVEEYIKHGRENALDGRWMKELENASARVHVTRLESLKLQLQQQAELLFGNQLDEFDRLIYKTYSESYAHTAFEIQKGIGVGWQLHKLTSGEIRKMLARPWTTDGQTFSDRIWQNKRALINTVSTQLTQMVMRGTAPDQAIKTIADRFQVSKRQAGRLVMTETAAFANEARKDCFNDLDVEKYVIVETLDGQTCPLCGQLDGRVYPMSDYAVGVTAPPFHPWCRGTTAPWFDDLQGLGYRAARDEKGEYYEVPREMTYEQWKKAFVDGDKAGLKKVSGSGIISLNDAETRALHEYISSGSYKINESLRMGSALTKEQQEFVEALDAALGKMPVYEGEVYRSITDFGIEDIDSFLAEYVPKKIISFPAYTSSGTEIYDEGFPIQYVIQSKTGRDIRQANPSEYEILFPRNTQFRVVRVDGKKIFLEEV